MMFDPWLEVQMSEDEREYNSKHSEPGHTSVPPAPGCVHDYIGGECQTCGGIEPAPSLPTYWCCGGDFGKHEPSCKNATPPTPSPEITVSHGAPPGVADAFAHSSYVTIPPAPTAPCEVCGSTDPDACRGPYHGAPAAPDVDNHANPSLSELTQESGVKPITDPSVLAGWVPDDEDMDAVIRVIYDARGGGAPSSDEMQDPGKCPHCNGYHVGGCSGPIPRFTFREPGAPAAQDTAREFWERWPDQDSTPMTAIPFAEAYAASRVQRLEERLAKQKKAFADDLAGFMQRRVPFSNNRLTSAEWDQIATVVLEKLAQAALTAVCPLTDGGMCDALSR